MISRLFSSSLIAAGQLQPANLPHRSAAHLHKCAAWALNTSRFFSDGSIRRIRKTKRKSSLTKRVVDAVEAYKEIYGNLEVKHSFVIPKEVDGIEPDSRWPKVVHGLKLGTRIGEIRTEYRNGIYRSSEIDRPIELLLAKLEKMGFIFSIREQQVELLRLALKTYKSIYNDLNISKFFTCPVGDSLWPEKTWGMKLGFTVGNIRNKGNFPELEEELQAMGMNFSPSTDHRGGQLILTAVTRFFELYGHYKIPFHFQVPADRNILPSMFKRRSEMVSKNVIEEGNLFNKRRNGTEHSFEEWPEEVRGLKLGFKFHNMYYWRSLSTFRSIVEERGYFVDMEAPHSLWSTNNVYGDLLVALKEFKSIYGHLNVPPDFIVPIDKKNMNINNKDQNIMHYDSNKNDNCNNNDDNHNNNKEHNDKKLETPYFDYINSKEYRKSLIFDNAIKWSKKSQGLKLGLKVRHLRFRAKFLAKNREELTALGFDWRQSENNDKDVLDQTKNLDFDENY